MLGINLAIGCLFEASLDSFFSATIFRVLKAVKGFKAWTVNIINWYITFVVLLLHLIVRVSQTHKYDLKWISDHYKINNRKTLYQIIWISRLLHYAISSFSFIKPFRSVVLPLFSLVSLFLCLFPTNNHTI